MNNSYKHSIFVAFLNAIGDCVLMTSFLQGLRTIYPQSRITLAVQIRCAPLFRACPIIDKLIPISMANTSDWENIVTQSSEGMPYDLSICPRWDTDLSGARYLARASKAKRRVGFLKTGYKNTGHSDDDPINTFTEIFTCSPEMHEQVKYMFLLNALGYRGPPLTSKIWLDIPAKEPADQLISTGQLERFVVIAPFAQIGRREWPIDRYKLLAKKLMLHTGLTSVFIGKDIEQRELAETGAIHLPIKYDILTAAALISKALMLVGADSGPMHIASAFKLPTVAISCHPKGGADFHANSPKRFGPTAPLSISIQPRASQFPCTDYCQSENQPHCIKQISTQEVFKACMEIFSILDDN